MCTPHFFFFFLEEPKGLRQWAPRSVGPYGVGRAPTPLMHAPTGACIWAPLRGAHYRSRLFSFFVARPPFGLPALMGALKGTHMCTPKGCTLYNACARVRVYVKPEGQFWPFYSLFRPKLAGDFLLGSTSWLFFFAGSYGPSNPLRGYGNPIGYPFQK